jgi:hypothetical protein
VEYFEDLYKDQLAFRLLSRYNKEINLSISQTEHSYAIEKDLLSLLPKLPSAAVMIVDIEKTYHRMNDFRKHLIYRIDNDELLLDNDLWGQHTPIDLAITPGDINIHILSSSWPNITSTYTYNTLKIPFILSTIVEEFEVYLYNQEKKSSSVSLSNNATSNRGTKLLWCHGSSKVVLTYQPQSSSSGPYVYMYICKYVYMYICMYITNRHFYHNCSFQSIFYAYLCLFKPFIHHTIISLS